MPLPYGPETRNDFLIGPTPAGEGWAPRSRSLMVLSFGSGHRAVLMLLLATVVAPVAGVRADEDDEATRLYNTREERRDAGIEHQLAPGLTASGLLEWEANRERLSGTENTESTDEADVTAQVGVKAVVHDNVQGETVLEFDTATDRLVVDEAVVEVDVEPWGLALGRQYLPFGIFYSQFASGPLLEFGETRATAATVSYDFSGTFELSVSLYRGRARTNGTRSRGVDWALSAEAQPTERLSIGFSYLDDLADADSGLLEDEDNEFSRKVSAASAYAILSMGDFEASFEFLGATRSFSELPDDRNRPSAWNLEITHFVDPRFDWGVRLEASRELEDAPELQYGLAGNFQLHEQATLTLEILRGRFQGALAVDDDDNPYRRIDQVGLLLSVAF